MTPLKVIYNYAAAPEFALALKELGKEGLDVSVCPESNDDLLFQLLPDTEVLWHCLRPVDQQVINAAPQLKLIQKIGVGVNTIDLALAKKKSIAVCNMPGTNSRAVAEHTLGLMLSALRQTRRFDTDLRTGNGWLWNADRQDQLGELHGRTVGMVGYGGIPRLLTPILHAMGAQVCYTATSEKPDVSIDYLPLQQLLRRSDIVSLHLPLTSETERLINESALSRMRPGSLLINTARGGLIDEAALHRALQSGHLAAAGLDVFADEPLAAEHPFLELANVVLTPHIAWLTRETLLRSIEVAKENCQRLRSGKQLLYQIS